MATTLEVDRSDLRRTRLHEAESEPLAPGQVRMRIDRVALTANTVTYAVAGDILAYWDFYPTEAGWGRVPAMGWADLVESAHPDIEVGGRYYGWWPMGTEVVLTASPTAEGLRDDGPHRAPHAAAYRSFTRTDLDPWYDAAPDGEDRQALLRGLFLTGFLLDAQLADAGDHGADAIVVSSASSKTSIALAVCAAERGARLVGLTSPGNVDFVRSLGLYGDVVTYDEVTQSGLAGIDDVASVVVVDVAGNGEVLAKLHSDLGDTIAASITVGMSHHDAPRVEITAGPTPQMFFAPGAVGRCIEQWGPEGWATRTASGLAAFVESSRSWLDLTRAEGPDATLDTWLAALDGAIGPAVGQMVSMQSSPQA
jgi:hypothetical protein